MYGGRRGTISAGSDFGGAAARAASGAARRPAFEGKAMRIAKLLRRPRMGLRAAAFAAVPAAMLAAAALTADARAAEPAASQAWKRLDRGAKGYITFEDFVRASDERLARMDKNGDGAIGRDEFMAYHEAEARRRVDRIFGALDKKGTGRIAAAALQGPDARRLLVCDANKDGAITRSEYLACRRRVAERWMQRIFAKYDKNGDGFIGRDERVAALRGFFDGLDANKDGRISREEFGVAQKRWADRRSATTSNLGGKAPQSDLDALE
jgi:Ca2+-binding EF-hand superfamily protein